MPNLKRSKIEVKMYGQSVGYLISKDNMVYFEYDSTFKAKQLYLGRLTQSSPKSRY